VKRWQWPGLMRIDVPEDWSVNDLPGLVEIAPANGSGALHVSVLDPLDQSVVSDPEPIARRWNDPSKVRGFRITKTEQVANGRRCWAEWRSGIDGQDGAWTLAVTSYRSHVFVATYVGAARDQKTRRIAHAILQSLRADEG
jgi:hypothetical protein